MVVLHRLQAVVVLRHQCDKGFRRVFTDVRALQTAGHKVELFIFQQFAHHNLRFVTREFAVKKLFAMLKHQRAVFGHERDLVFEFGEERDELVILIAAGDDEFNVAFF